ncbi:thiamine pyrophosphate-dependent enzyme [Dehalococcoidia bacterium]|nr:thiamine pyrophosphate-dependent enzyme [Dehalococcoidia bacterium]
MIANLGPTSTDLWHTGDRARNFYTHGSMGLCSSIALGMALSVSDKVISLDGDGSMLMNMGTIATISREKPKNLIVVVWDNEEWGQTGHQPSHTATGTNLEHVARACGISKSTTVCYLEELDEIFQKALREDGPWFIVAKIQETDYLSRAPNEPDMTLYRFRNTFL